MLCWQWLGSQWGEFEVVGCAQVLAISRYDGRGAMSLQDSVKSQHILPFFPNFVVLASRLENLLAGTQGHSPGEGPQQHTSSMSYTCLLLHVLLQLLSVSCGVKADVTEQAEGLMVVSQQEMT